MFVFLTIVLCVGAGTVGGVFFAFSAFVMKALAALPASQGVAAMQRINVVVLNPLFLTAFVGTTLVAALLAIASLFHWQWPGSALSLGAGLLYASGAFCVTIAFNVPMNDRLAGLDAASPEAAAYWPVYVRDWSRWNHVRTAASVGSTVCSAAALAA